MAQTQEFQKSHYPLPVYNFRVTIEAVVMSFAEVSGITLAYETVTYRHGLSFLEGEQIKKFYFEKYETVTFKKGTVKGMKDLYDWVRQEGQDTKMIEVSLCDENGEPVVSWRIGKAVPVKLQAPTFDANSNDVSIESLEVLAAGITLIHH